jgi:ATP-dependent Clp protease protease subunit
LDVTSWNDEMRARLLERRTVLMSGDLDDRLASDVAAQLMLLDATGDGSVQLQVDCSGRSLDAAFAVMDTIDLLGVGVHVSCVGRAEGAAVGVLAVGHHRAVAEHARIRLCDPEISLEGRASQLAAYATHANERVTSFHERLAAATHRKLGDIAEACREGRFLSAEEAVSFGLADEIASRGATIHPWPGVGLGFRPHSRRA